MPAIVRYADLSRTSLLDPTFASVMDLAPTLLELAGTAHPGTAYQGREVLPMKGRSQRLMQQVMNTFIAEGWL